MEKIFLNIFSLLLLTLFLYPILPQYIYIIGGINVVNALVFLFCLFYIFCHRRIVLIKMKNNIVFHWIYVAIIAISYLNDAEFLKTATYVMAFILLPWFIISVVNSEERFIKVVDILILAGFFLGVLGIIESILKTNFIQLFASRDIEFFHEIRYGLLRIMTTFGQPISYGLYQVFIIALINYRKNSFNHKHYLNICYWISVINIFLSVSRIPIIAFIIVQMSLVYRKSSKRFKNYLFFIVILMLLYLMITTLLGLRIPFVDDFLETVNQFISGSNTITKSTVGVGDRFELWSWVYLSMDNRWILGHGPTAEFAFQVHEWQTKTSIENQYLNVLWHNGVLGLVTLILSYISILRFSFQRKNESINKSKENISFNIIICIIMFTYYLVSLGVQESDMARIYTIFIALLISYNRIISKRRSKDEDRITGI